MNLHSRDIQKPLPSCPQQLRYFHIFGEQDFLNTIALVNKLYLTIVSILQILLHKIFIHAYIFYIYARKRKNVAPHPLFTSDKLYLLTNNYISHDKLINMKNVRGTTKSQYKTTSTTMHTSTH